MLVLATSGVISLAAFVLFALAVGLVRRYPPAGIGLAALVIVSIWEAPVATALLTFEGVNVTASDVITLILFVAGLLEFTQLRTNLQGWLIPWLFLGVLIAIALLRGAATHGLALATNEARGVLWVYFAITWALATRPDRFKLHTVSLVLGWMLVLVAFYHGVEHGIGSPTTVVIRADGSYGPNRILVAGQAAALLLCAGTVFLRTADSGKGRPRFAGSSLVFLSVVLLSQHRSVWIAGLVGMTAVLIFARGGRARGGAPSRAFALLAVGAWLAIAGWTLRSAADEVVDSAVNTGTLDWRTSGWQTLVSDAIARGPVTIAIRRTVRQRVSPNRRPRHDRGAASNWYVQIFLRLGIIGLLLFAGMLMAAVSKSRAKSSEWTFLLVAVGVYASAYVVDWFLAPWLAAAMVVSLRGGGVTDETLESTPSKGTSAGRVGASNAPGSATSRIQHRGRAAPRAVERPVPQVRAGLTPWAAGRTSQPNGTS